MRQEAPFPDTRQTVADEQVVTVLRVAVSRSRGLTRVADLILCGTWAEYLVGRLHPTG